ncbi:tetratricopeptide (TPR) repeat protein [Pontibacter aydingkolensis]|uniref:Tetratricopeptide repeat protein n=1 Tax=Pontibacter aydingkolensis TaxID=1911536 RepID=A0ABS7CSL7_9BACT|nr:tetratricopeptide repeat protein [Pontibacter aydingkolensis]MBW7466848.1 tetratricopeptide repeat protein [Pontibacter aydingkolensis]
MKKLLKYFMFILCYGFASTNAQDLTTRDAGQVIDKTDYLIKEYESFLNTLTNAGMRPSDIKLMIKNAYSLENNQRLFWDNKVIVEDDINPEKAEADSAADLPVDRYLEDLDLLYAKSREPSITFYNIDVSKIKKADYYYVKVYFDSSFHSKHKKSKKSYKPVRRVAEVRLENQDSKWMPYMVGLRYYVREDSINDAKNDVPIVAVEDVGSEVRTTIQSRNEEYQEYIRIGEKALGEENYEVAKTAFEKALALRPNSSHSLRKLQQINNINWYEYHYKKGVKAKQERNYEEAIAYFRKAKEEKLTDATIRSEMDQSIDEMSGIIRNRDLFISRFEAGKYDELIKEYSKHLKNSNQPNFTKAEIHLFLAKSYTAKGEYEDALKEYTEAIRKDPNFTQALRERAALYTLLSYSQKNINDKNRQLREAHADYSVLISNNPNIAEHYKLRSTTRIQLNELNDALSDLEQAIKLDPKNATRYYDKAIFLIDNKEDLVGAYSSLSTAIDLDSTYAQAYFKRGFIEHKHFTDVSKAAKDFSKALKYELSDFDKGTIKILSETHYKEGNQLYLTNDYKAAVSEYDNAITINPENAYAHFMRGEALFSQGIFIEAIGSYTNALSFTPDLNIAIFKRGVSYHRLGDFEQAIADFKQVTEKTLPANTLFFDNSIAMCKSYQGLLEYQSANTVAESTITQLKKFNESTSAKINTATVGFVSVKSFDQKNSLAELYNIAGRCKYEMKLTKDALKDLDKSLSFNKRYSAAYYNRGVVYYSIGDYKKAIKDFSSNLVHGTKKSKDYFVRAQSYQMLNKHSEAISDYQTAILVDTALVDAHYYRGISLAKLGTLEEALLYYNMYLDSDFIEEASANYYAERGTIKFKLRQYEEARKDFLKALEIDTVNTEALYGLGFLNVVENKLEDAIPSFQEAFKSKKISRDRVNNDFTSISSSVAKDKRIKELIKTIDKKTVDAVSYSVLMD